jgi:hypothetical protein
LCLNAGNNAKVVLETALMMAFIPSLMVTSNQQDRLPSGDESAAVFGLDCRA